MHFFRYLLNLELHFGGYMIKKIFITSSFLMSSLAFAQGVPPMPPGPAPEYNPYHSHPMMPNQFDIHHPRVVELNRRLDFENQKLQELMDSGQIDPYRARTIKNQIRAVRGNIHNAFRMNGGFLTDGQIVGFSNQENQIRQELHVMF